MLVEAPNIRCFSIHPGAVDTAMLRNTAQQVGVDLKWRWTQPELTGAIILWLTTARAGFMRGRWLSTNWNVHELEALKQDIVGQNLLKTAFNAKLGI